jgi:hypothetical protein
MNWQEFRCEIKDCPNKADGFAYTLPRSGQGPAKQLFICQSCYCKEKKTVKK